MTRTAAQPPTVHDHLRQWERWLHVLAHRYGTRYHIEHDEAVSVLVLFVLENFRTYNPRRGAFSTWVTLNARHAFRPFLASRRERNAASLSMQATNEGGSESCTLADSIADPRERGPASQADTRAVCRRVRSALATLTDEERQVIHGRFFSAADPQTDTRERYTLRTALLKLQDVLDPLEEE